MKSKELILIIGIGIFVFCLDSWSSAHSGGTDANGGHYNRKTGEYHYHGGGGGTTGSKRTSGSSSNSSNSRSTSSGGAGSSTGLFATDSGTPMSVCHVSPGGNVAMSAAYEEDELDEYWYTLWIAPEEDGLFIQFVSKQGETRSQSKMFPVTEEALTQYRDELTTILENYNTSQVSSPEVGG